MSERRYTDFLEVAPDAIIIIDAEGFIEYANEQAEYLFHYKRQYLIGKQIELLLPDRFRANHSRHRDGYVKDPRRRAMGEGTELYGLRADGQEIAVDISLAPIMSQDGIRFAAAIRDVTAQKQAVRVIGQTIARTTEWLSQLDTALAQLSPGRRTHP